MPAPQKKQAAGNMKHHVRLDTIVLGLREMIWDVISSKGTKAALCAVAAVVLLAADAWLGFPSCRLVATVLAGTVYTVSGVVVPPAGIDLTHGSLAFLSSLGDFATKIALASLLPLIPTGLLFLVQDRGINWLLEKTLGKSVVLKSIVRHIAVPLTKPTAMMRVAALVTPILFEAFVAPKPSPVAADGVQTNTSIGLLRSYLEKQLSLLFFLIPTLLRLGVLVGVSYTAVDYGKKQSNALWLMIFQIFATGAYYVYLQHSAYGGYWLPSTVQIALFASVAAGVIGWVSCFLLPRLMKPIVAVIKRPCKAAKRIIRWLSKAIASFARSYLPVWLYDFMIEPSWARAIGPIVEFYLTYVLSCAITLWCVAAGPSVSRRLLEFEAAPQFLLPFGLDRVARHFGKSGAIPGIGAWKGGAPEIPWHLIGNHGFFLLVSIGLWAFMVYKSVTIVMAAVAYLQLLFAAAPILDVGWSRCSFQGLRYDAVASAKASGRGRVRLQADGSVPADPDLALVGSLYEKVKHFSDLLKSGDAKGAAIALLVGKQEQQPSTERPVVAGSGVDYSLVNSIMDKVGAVLLGGGGVVTEVMGVNFDEVTTKLKKKAFVFRVAVEMPVVPASAAVRIDPISLELQNIPPLPEAVEAREAALDEGFVLGNANAVADPVEAPSGPPTFTDAWLAFMQLSDWSILGRGLRNAILSCGDNFEAGLAGQDSSYFPGIDDPGRTIASITTDALEIPRDCKTVTVGVRITLRAEAMEPVFEGLVKAMEILCERLKPGGGLLEVAAWRRILEGLQPEAVASILNQSMALFNQGFRLLLKWHRVTGGNSTLSKPVSSKAVQKGVASELLEPLVVPLLTYVNGRSSFRGNIFVEGGKSAKEDHERAAQTTRAFLSHAVDSMPEVLLDTLRGQMRELDKKLLQPLGGSAHKQRHRRAALAEALEPDSAERLANELVTCRRRDAVTVRVELHKLGIYMRGLKQALVRNENQLAGDEGSDQGHNDAAALGMRRRQRAAARALVRHAAVAAEGEVEAAGANEDGAGQVANGRENAPANAAGDVAIDNEEEELLKLALDEEQRQLLQRDFAAARKIADNPNAVPSKLLTLALYYAISAQVKLKAQFPENASGPSSAGVSAAASSSRHQHTQSAPSQHPHAGATYGHHRSATGYAAAPVSAYDEAEPEIITTRRRDQLERKRVAKLLRQSIKQNLSCLFGVCYRAVGAEVIERSSRVAKKLKGGRDGEEDDDGDENEKSATGFGLLGGGSSDVTTTLMAAMSVFQLITQLYAGGGSDDGQDDGAAGLSTFVDTRAAAEAVNNVVKGPNSADATSSAQVRRAAAGGAGLSTGVAAVQTASDSKAIATALGLVEGSEHAKILEELMKGTVKVVPDAPASARPSAAEAAGGGAEERLQLASSAPVAFSIDADAILSSTMRAAVRPELEQDDDSVDDEGSAVDSAAAAADGISDEEERVRCEHNRKLFVEALKPEVVTSESHTHTSNWIRVDDETIRRSAVKFKPPLDEAGTKRVLSCLSKIRTMGKRFRYNPGLREKGSCRPTIMVLSDVAPGTEERAMLNPLDRSLLDGLSVAEAMADPDRREQVREVQERQAAALAEAIIKMEDSKGEEHIIFPFLVAASDAAKAKAVEAPPKDDENAREQAPAAPSPKKLLPLFPWDPTRSFTGQALEALSDEGSSSSEQAGRNEGITRSTRKKRVALLADKKAELMGWFRKVLRFGKGAEGAGSIHEGFVSLPVQPKEMPKHSDADSTGEAAAGTSGAPKVPASTIKILPMGAKPWLLPLSAFEKMPADRKERLKASKLAERPDGDGGEAFFPLPVAELPAGVPVPASASEVEDEGRNLSIVQRWAKLKAELDAIFAPPSDSSGSVAPGSAEEFLPIRPGYSVTSLLHGYVLAGCSIGTKALADTAVDSAFGMPLRWDARLDFVGSPYTAEERTVALGAMAVALAVRPLEEALHRMKEVTRALETAFPSSKPLPVALPGGMNGEPGPNGIKALVDRDGKYVKAAPGNRYVNEKACDEHVACPPVPKPAAPAASAEGSPEAGTTSSTVSLLQKGLYEVEKLDREIFCVRHIPISVPLRLVPEAVPAPAPVASSGSTGVSSSSSPSTASDEDISSSSGSSISAGAARLQLGAALAKRFQVGGSQPTAAAAHEPAIPAVSATVPRYDGVTSRAAAMCATGFDVEQGFPFALPLREVAAELATARTAMWQALLPAVSCVLYCAGVQLSCALHSIAPLSDAVRGGATAALAAAASCPEGTEVGDLVITTTGTAALDANVELKKALGDEKAADRLKRVQAILQGVNIYLNAALPLLQLRMPKLDAFAKEGSQLFATRREAAKAMGIELSRLQTDAKAVPHTICTPIVANLPVKILHTVQNLPPPAAMLRQPGCSAVPLPPPAPPAVGGAGLRTQVTGPEPQSDAAELSAADRTCVVAPVEKMANPSEGALRSSAVPLAMRTAQELLQKRVQVCLFATVEAPPTILASDGLEGRCYEWATQQNHARLVQMFGAAKGAATVVERELEKLSKALGLAKPSKRR